MARGDNQSGREAAFEALKLKALEGHLPALMINVQRAMKEAESIDFGLREAHHRLNKGQIRKAAGKDTIQIGIPSIGGRNYSFVFEKRGMNWQDSGWSIVPYIEAMYGKKPVRASTQDLEPIKGMFRRRYQLAPFFENLLDKHPILGLGVLIRYDQEKTRATKPEGGGAERPNWFGQFVEQLASLSGTIENVFSDLETKAPSNTTKNFLKDVQREIELMFLGVLHVGFGCLQGQIDAVSHTKGNASLLSTFYYPVNPRDRVVVQRKIANLKQVYAEYLTQDDKVLNMIFPRSAELSRTDIDQFTVPVHIFHEDLLKLVEFFNTYWKGVEEALQQKRIPVQKQRAGSTLFEYDNGCTIRVRKEKFTQREEKRDTSLEARIAIRYKDFSMRVDHDENRESMMVDFGGANISHALAAAEFFISNFIKHSTRPMTSGTIMAEKLDGAQENLTNEHRLSLLVAAMLANLYGVSLTKKHHVSHHSNEFVGKGQYYKNFSTIAQEVETILAHKKE